MREMVLTTLIAMFTAGPIDVWASQRPVPSDVELTALQQMAKAIPLGTRVTAQTNRGQRVTGTLMGVTDEAVIIKKKSRLPEPAVMVRFADLAQLERETNGGGMNVAKVIGIGLAAGAGAILTLIAFAAAIDD